MKGMSLAGVKVLAALSGSAGTGSWVMTVTGLTSGTVYPLLRRMGEAGFVVGSEATPRVYRLTAAGEAWAAAVRQEVTNGQAERRDSSHQSRDVRVVGDRGDHGRGHRVDADVVDTVRYTEDEEIA